MGIKTHWKKLVNPDYIGAYCVENDLIVKITGIQRENVKGEGGKSDDCTVAKLEGQKPFIINRTNAKIITKLHKSPYIEDWVGKSIIIYPTTTKVAGEIVECLRVRTVLPQIEKIDYTEQEQLLKSCLTLDELKAAFISLSHQAQSELVTLKDQLKATLTA